jgi:poly(3-hydroxybutyrate) depolymerase
MSVRTGVLAAVVAALAASGCASSAAQAVAPAAAPASPSATPGLGQFDHVSQGRTIRVWTYEPPGAGPDAAVVFVLHGVRRNGEEYREPWIPLCQQYHCVALVPEFSARDWPGSRSYNNGNVRDETGKPLPQERWAFSAIDEIFAHYKDRSRNRTARYFIFGHSAGGQFVHRMALLRPDAAFAVAVAANPGAYTMPSWDVSWPFGMREAPADEAKLRAALSRRLVVLLGDRDIDPNDSQLPRSPEAMAQGPHRFARGHRFFDEARAAAARLGVPLRWQLQVVPGVAHDNKKMAPAAAALMLAPASPALTAHP